MAPNIMRVVGTVFPPAFLLKLGVVVSVLPVHGCLISEDTEADRTKEDAHFGSPMQSAWKKDQGQGLVPSSTRVRCGQEEWPGEKERNVKQLMKASLLTP